jgi:hypothetical protein
MIYSDGECPVCRNKNEPLALNTLDLLECPKCNLMFSGADPLILALFPTLGDRRFRFENYNRVKISGAGIAKKQDNLPLPNDNEIFFTQESLNSYAESIYKSADEIKMNKLWFKFREEFKQFIEKTPINKLSSIASSKPKRTSYYQAEVMPYIASELGLVHGNEEFKVDYVMSKRTSSDLLIPKVYIESENDFNSATQEVRKLCSLNSELRVLVTAYEGKIVYDELQAKFFSKLREWQNIIREHKKENKEFFRGTIGMIFCHINKKDRELDFYCCSFWDNGDLQQPLSLLLKILF